MGSKHLRQTLIVPKQTLSVEDVAAANDEESNKLPNVDIYAKIYAYCKVATATVGTYPLPLYVSIFHGRDV